MKLLEHGIKMVEKVLEWKVCDIMTIKEMLLSFMHRKAAIDVS